LNGEEDTPLSIEFYFATHNTHKFEEAEAALAEVGIKVKKLERPFEKIEIQHPNLEEIAITALSVIIREAKENIFVEDSGLFVHELNGFPGPYSSYVFETIGVEGILKQLNGAKNRKAEFRSSVAMGSDGKIIAVFSSVAEGNITLQPRGESGFGFDPIFIPMWTNKTFSEMTLSEKNVYSHRSKALKKLGLWYQNASKTGNFSQAGTAT
jgi:XTP/dITP diphosphohydrolase